MSDHNQKDPLSLLTKDIVEAALVKDLGPQWNLLKFEVKDFTQKGDNYCCKVTSVCCTAACNDEEKSVTYVVKLNPQHSSSYMDDILLEFFEKECKFYCSVGVKLNKILTDVNYPIIHFPEYLYSNLEKGAQVLITKDLREKNFQMFNRKSGMDYDHAILVLKELAKLHAASMIFKANLREKTVLEEYPFLVDVWLKPETKSRELYKNIMTGNLEAAIKQLQQVEGYDQHIKWIENLKSKIMDIYYDTISSGPDDMKVICHGDCWNNNLLFSYDSCGKPIDLYFVDLQLCRYGSIGLDLTYFFSLSLTGEVRDTYQKEFISIYYKELGSILTAANQPIKFTEERLREEIRNKIIYGIINGLTLLQIMTCEGDDAPDFTELDADSISSAFANALVNTSEKSPLFQTRFLAIVDCIKRYGFLQD